MIDNAKQTQEKLTEMAHTVLGIEERKRELRDLATEALEWKFGQVRNRQEAIRSEISAMKKRLLDLAATANQFELVMK